MALLLKNGAIFLHIPKTGGTFVVRVLRELNLVERKLSTKHSDYVRTLCALSGTTAFRKRHVVSKLFKTHFDENTFVFSFVRHPLAWYESAFLYLCRKGWPKYESCSERDSWHPFQEFNVIPDEAKISYEEFLKWIINYNPGYCSRMYYKYTDWPLVKYIGKQESLEENLIEVLNQMDIKVDRSIFETVGRPNAREGYEGVIVDNALKQQILQLEGPALKLFGYASSPFFQEGT